MGGDQSNLSSSADSSAILNFILREMFRRADLVDMYSLADPARCKDYLVVSSKALSKFFSQINLMPREKDGTLYFQSIQGMIKGMSTEDRAMHQQNCNKLAFYFIRIFQIYGALTLSVIDGVTPTIDPIIPQPIKRRTAYSPMLARPLPGFPTPPERTSFWSGGALSPSGSRTSSFYINDAHYEILNKYLDAPQDINRQPDNLSKSNLTFAGGLNMEIPQETLYNLRGSLPEGRTLKPSNELVPRIVYMMRDSPIIRLDAKLTIEKDNNTYNVTLSDFKRDAVALTKVPNLSISKTFKSYYAYDDPKDENDRKIPEGLQKMFKDATASELGESTIQFLYDNKYISAIDERPTNIAGTRVMIDNPRATYREASIPITYTDSVRIDNRTVELRIQAAMQITKAVTTTMETKYTLKFDFSKAKIFPSSLDSSIDFGSYADRTFTTTRSSSPPRDIKNQSMPTYIQAHFDRILKDLKEGKVSAARISYTREGYIKPRVLSAEVPEELKINKLWEGLAKDPPVKAHCVARALQLLNAAAIQGKISDAAYSSICKTKFPYVVDKSLPARGQSIADEYGIGALANLFVDSIQANLPKISDTSQYRASLNTLATAFQSEYDPPASVIPTVRDIKDESLNDICTTDSIIEIKKPMAGTLRSFAQQLIRRQAQHLRSVMALLFTLFNENRIRAGILEMHPNVITGGMEQINRISVLARDLLVQYYSDCETTYKAGVSELQKDSTKVFLSPSGVPIAAAPVDEVYDEDDEDDDAGRYSYR